MTWISKLVLLVTLMSQLLTSCSNDGLLVTDTSWNCHRKKSNPVCDVKFTLENTNHFSIAATVAILAHRRGSVMGSDAITNRLIGQQILKFDINAGEIKEMQVELKVRGNPTQIVVTATSVKI